MRTVNFALNLVCLDMIGQESSIPFARLITLNTSGLRTKSLMLAIKKSVFRRSEMTGLGVLMRFLSRSGSQMLSADLTLIA